MTLLSQLQAQQRQREKASTGEARGLYLRAERSSKVAFGPIFLGNDGAHHALAVLNKQLDKLYASHAVADVGWYIERSHGIDVHGKILWGNIDVTDCVVP
jgi:hypothetical protein